MSTHSTRVIIKKYWKNGNPPQLIDFLAEFCELSKSTLKESLNQGSCWIRKNGKKELKRVRRAKTLLDETCYIEFYYDQELFIKQKDYVLEDFKEVKKHAHFSVWCKPAGMLAQGTKYGDKMSVLRQVELLTNKDVFLIHRLDRETVGLILIAHTYKAAKALSKLWQERKVRKVYQALVLGDLLVDKGSISNKLDGKKAITHFRVLKRNGDTTLLELEIETGRTHQIRRHLLDFGHPVIGDSRYGENNKNEDGLKLMATELSFTYSNETFNVCVPSSICFR